MSSDHFDDFRPVPVDLPSSEVLQQRLPESTHDACPDTGTCHHACPTTDGRHGVPCFRVLTCAPLSIAGFPGDRWPDAVRQEHGAPPAPREVDLTQAARWVRLMRDDPDMGLAYRGALGCWTELLGLASDGDAVDLIDTLADADPPVTAVVAPF